MQDAVDFCMFTPDGILSMALSPPADGGAIPFVHNVTLYYYFYCYFHN